ncbi:FAD/NAD(P)-binding domain-containing protein, partial [Lophiostoma macrostomum CBS 122681]
IIVGAGIGGTTTALLLSRKVKNITIDVFDRFPKIVGSTIGGTWAANVYPGVRCDVPSHAYQLSFAPNTQWSEYYPQGAEIQQYYENTVKRFGLFDRFHLRHEVLGATWDERLNVWSVEVRNLDTGHIRTETADFFISSQGRISTPKYLQLEGLYTKFRGEVIHTARWRDEVDLTGRRVAVIGNGASGQQLIPNILSKVQRIDHYVRTKTWVTATFAKDLYEASADASGGPKFTNEELDLFKKDPKAYLEFRRQLELTLHRPPGADVLGSEANHSLRDAIIDTMLRRIGGDKDFLARILPDYAPGCKRLTPAPGYLEALVGPKVDYITDRIVRADETGLWTADGVHREVDVIVTATGFETGFTTHFPVLGLGGVDLKEAWSQDGELGYPNTYLGIMAPNVPNYFTVLQAQGNARGGTVPLQIEIAATFIAKATRKIQSQSYVALHPSAHAATEFNDIVSGYFDDKVTSDKCGSWFKQAPGRSRVLIAWPGSLHHRAGILKDPRWEDFHFVRSPDAKRNRFEYFGNGWTEKEARGDEREITDYLHEVRDVFEAAEHAHEAVAIKSKL